jgi:hypothetical protein
MKHVQLSGGYGEEEKSLHSIDGGNAFSFCCS